MKNFTLSTHHYTFDIYFLDSCDKTFAMKINFSTSAPHYEAAVSQALVQGHQVMRDAEKQYGRNLFMRVCRV